MIYTYIYIDIDIDIDIDIEIDIDIDIDIDICASYFYAKELRQTPLLEGANAANFCASPVPATEDACMFAEITAFHAGHRTCLAQGSLLPC